MSLSTNITIHLENAPFEAAVRELPATDVMALAIGQPPAYGGLSLFFRAEHRERVEKIAALLNEMRAPALVAEESQS
ncbi:MAG: hypothetical protein ACOZAM_15250 [Pseudomonadota bacterium]